MQLGFILVLLAIGAGLAAALWEDTRVAAAIGCMALCGLLLMAAGYNFGMYPESITRAWGAGVSNVFTLFSWIGGMVIEIMSLLWLAKHLSSKMRR